MQQGPIVVEEPRGARSWAVTFTWQTPAGNQEATEWYHYPMSAFARAAFWQEQWSVAWRGEVTVVEVY